MANKDVGSAEVKCPDNSISVFLKCVDSWNFTQQVHVRLSGDKEGTDETQNRAKFSDLLKGSYKIELTLTGEDALYKDQEAYLKSNFSPLKKLTLERKDGEEETTLKADVPVEKEPDKMAVFISFKPPYHAVSGVYFADPDNLDTKTPAYASAKELEEADIKEKQAFKADAEDLKISWELQKDDDQLKAEFVKKAQVSIFNNKDELVWFEYIDEAATKEAEKGALDWKGDTNVSEFKGQFKEDLIPGSFSPFTMKMEVKQGVGICKQEEIWTYLERACLLKLLLWRGTLPRETKYNLDIFDTEDNLKGGSPLFQLEEVSSLGTVVSPDIPAKFALKTMLVGVKFLDDQNNETGEGLVLKIEDPGSIDKPSVSSQRLQCLGYYKDPNPLTEETIGDVAEQKYLDFYFVWASYQRSKQNWIADLAEADWKPLEKEYWNYEYLPVDIQAEKIDPANLEKQNIVRLRLLRGSSLISRKCDIEVATYFEEKLEIGEGGLRIDIPAAYMKRAKIAKVYYLDENDERAGEGLLLQLQQPETIGYHTGGSWRLKALGFYQDAALTASPADKEFNSFYTAAAAYQRTKSQVINNPETIPWNLLEKDYWEYEFQKPELLVADIEPAGLELSVIIKMKLFRGGDVFSGKCNVEIGAYIIKELDISEGNLEIEVPTKCVNRYKLAKIYYLDEKGQPTGEAFLGQIKEPDSIGKLPGGSWRLKALGFYNNAALTEETVDDRDFNPFYSATAGYQRSKKYLRSAPEDLFWDSLEVDYWDYQFQKPDALTVDLAPADPTLTTIIQVKLFRGPRAFSGKCRVEVGAYHIDNLEISGGNLSVEVPKQYTEVSKLAKVYYLDENDEPTGEGLLLRLQQPRETGNIIGGGVRFRSMGFYNKPPLLSKTVNERNFWDIYSSLAAYQRSMEEPPTAVEETVWWSVEGNYWEYNYQPFSLPYLVFPNDQTESLREAAQAAIPLCEH